MSIPTGIYVVVELEGALATAIASVQRRHDPKLAALWPPHLTLIGSSGAGPIVADTPIEDLRASLGGVAARTKPLTLQFGAPQRFADRDLVVLPLDPHGPLRKLHEDLRGSGVRMHPARYPFTPHVTLTMYPPLSRAREQKLLALRFDHPLLIDRLFVYLTSDPQPAKRLLELPLGTKGG
jgi:hypothetical protein